MSTQSLVLQHVAVDAVGDYTCRAVNVEGTGESNPVPLKIMCKYIPYYTYVEPSVKKKLDLNFQSLNCLTKIIFQNGGDTFL